jgi:hypothetical protein
MAVLVGNSDEDVKRRNGQRQQVVGVSLWRHGEGKQSSCDYNAKRYIRQRRKWRFTDGLCAVPRSSRNDVDLSPRLVAGRGKPKA